MSDGREKYNAYLASHEWSLLREQVRKRCGGVCERCFHNPMQNVHHTTYIRKYNEAIGDLQAMCRGCHEFHHGKTNKDPIMAVPVMYRGRVVRSVYLAGKITGTTWRDQIVVAGWSHGRGGGNDIAMGDGERSWSKVDGCIHHPDGKHKLAMTGPWWTPLEYMQGHGNIRHNTFSHAAGSAPIYGEFGHDGIDEIIGWGSAEEQWRQRFQVACNVQGAINSCDMLFAWVDSLDCYGTLYEIGLAKSAGKIVVVGTDSTVALSELWLSFAMADDVVQAPRDSEFKAREAWWMIWENSRQLQQKLGGGTKWNGNH